VFKLRTELQRSEATIKKLQETATLQAHNHNNTSSAFTLPSEFKKTWEVLVQENILDVFSPFLVSHTVFVFMVQSLVKLVVSVVKDTIQQKVKDIMGLLGGGEQEKVKTYLLKLFQDLCMKAFPLPDLDKIKHLYEEKVKDTADPEDLQDMLESPDFEEFIKTMHRICLHMLLNDPELQIEFKEELEYFKFDKPEDYYCIDGFPKGEPPCVVVLPEVMRGNYPYQGIKKAVLILSPDDPPLSSVEDSKNLDSIKKFEEEVKDSGASLDCGDLDCDSIKVHEDTKRSEESIKPYEEDNQTFREKTSINLQTSFHLNKMFTQTIETQTSPKFIDQPPEDSPFKCTKSIPSFKNILQERTHKISNLNFENLDSSPVLVKKVPQSQDFTPKQVLDLYCRYKNNIKKNQDTFPLQKSPCKRYEESFKDLRSSGSFSSAKKNSCKVCKPKLPCTRCSKTALLALAKRVPNNSYAKKHRTPIRTSSHCESPRDRAMSSLLSKKLNEAAHKMDRRSFIRNKVDDREACKVM